MSGDEALLQVQKLLLLFVNDDTSIRNTYPKTRAFRRLDTYAYSITFMHRY